MESKWFINHQGHKDNIVHLNKEAVSLKSPTDMYEGRLEPIKPGLDSQHNSACPSNDPQCTKLHIHIKHDVDKYETKIGKNQAAASSRQGCMSPRPQADNGAQNEKSCTPSPTLHISHNTIILAQLYHASRRSRHSPKRSGASILIPQKRLLPLPLTCSLFVDSEPSCNEMGGIDNNTHTETHHVHFATPISNDHSPDSVCSVESEDMITREAITASKLFDKAISERQPKRMKTSPNK